MSVNFYTAPSNMTGGMIVYGGYRRQRGAGAFGSFRKYMAPIGRQALQGLKSIAKNKTVRSIAKTAAQKGAEVLTGVAVDALQGRDVGEAFKERAREVALRSLTGEPTDVVPVINKRKRRRRLQQTSNQIKRKQVKQVKNLKQRKRRPSAKIVLRGPPSKRRRRALSRAALNRRDLF